MNPILRGILAVLSGAVVGNLVNMGLIMISGSIIPPPEGADLTTVEGLKASSHLLEPRHFIFPFLAHALGTLTGAVLAAIIVKKHKIKYALGIGTLFLIGGVIAAFMIPAPAWFIALDLIAAYLPMGFIAGSLVQRFVPAKS